MQVREAAGREGTQQVEGRGGLVVGLDHAPGVGRARGGVELDAVDDVAAVAGQLDPVLRLGRCRARLGELAGQPAHLHHRHAAGVHQHHRHLQQHLEGVADVVGAELGEALGAVAALQQERLATRHLCELVLEVARLAREHQRRKARELRLGRRQGLRVGIVRHLLDRLAPPAVDAPLGRHRLFPRLVPAPFAGFRKPEAKALFALIKPVHRSCAGRAAPKREAAWAPPPRGRASARGRAPYRGRCTSPGGRSRTAGPR